MEGILGEVMVPLLQLLLVLAHRIVGAVAGGCDARVLLPKLPR